MSLGGVMIAGIGGASLGTEIAKALRLAGRFEVSGCDISRTAYGLHSRDFVHTRHVDRARYVAGVIDACRSCGVRWLIPGGEEPMWLLNGAWAELAAADIALVGNLPAIVDLLSDKQRTFDALGRLGVAIPKTALADNTESIRSVGLPCIIKPATGSGGSAAVFLATDADEAAVYARYIRGNGHTPVAQEYIDAREGEFTVGVLSLPDGRLAGSIALRRSLDTKLSVSYRGRGGIISSGYSQGFIDEFPEICEAAEKIAAAIGSRGPINVQGRVRAGRFIPFEINPRFSASTYLRAMAGFNEVDLFLGFLATGETPVRGPVRRGWYLRSLAEMYVPAEAAA